MKRAAALGAILLLAAVVLGVVDLARGLSTPSVVTDLTLLPVVISLGVLGPVILGRQPGNAIGRLFCADLLLAGTIILIVPCIALGALAVAFRYRRARGIERQQLEWLVFGAGVAAFLFAVAFAFTISGTERAWNYIVPVALTCVVLAAGIAVLRYRLYDVDRLITRTVSYGLLSIVLAATYVGLVLAGQALFSAFAGGSDLAVAASTLVVAGLFLPLRTRVQRFVDRRFYRRRYNTRRTLESFGAHLRREVDLAMLSAELKGVVDETMQPAHVSLWLREAP